LRQAEGWLYLSPAPVQSETRLYRRVWLPDGDVRAVLLVVHGLGEHCGRYVHVAESLTSHGFAVHALDLVGHGKSTGTPGHVDAFRQYLDGVAALLEYVREQHPDRPVFLVGHSMGGLISTLFLLQNQSAFAGCVLSGPLIRSDAEPPRLLLVINRLVSALLPKLGMLELDATAVSRDPAVVEKYIEDPLVHHGKISSRLVNELFVSMTTATERASEIRLPILILHGEADRLTSPAGSELLYDQLGSPDKTLRLLPGLYHEIYNEPEQDQVLDEVRNWLDAHVPDKA